MKFNCGKKRDEKYYCNWHDHFAWWPVQVASCDCRWLEIVERKFKYIGIFSGYPREPSYRAKP